MRIVSLLPAATEIVAALGAGESLVGVTHECDHPAWVRGLPRVTASAVPVHASPGVVDAAVRQLVASAAPVFTLDEALISALAPDVLLTQALCDVCAVSERDVCALAERLSVGAIERRVATLGGTSLAGVCDDVRAVAAAIGRVEAGERLIAELERRLAAVAEGLTADDRRPRVAVVEWTDPVFLAGHWGPEMVRLAGGVDVLGTEGAHSTTVPLATLAATDPEIVLIAPCGYELTRAASEARALVDTDEWRWLAGRELWAIDANAVLSRPGPRLVDGVELLAAIFHPTRFPVPNGTLATRIEPFE
jgi:iron complex transport system substrate-binding protein